MEADYIAVSRQLLVVLLGPATDLRRLFSCPLVRMTKHDVHDDVISGYITFGTKVFDLVRPAMREECRRAEEHLNECTACRRTFVVFETARVERQGPTRPDDEIGGNAETV